MDNLSTISQYRTISYQRSNCANLTRRKPEGKKGLKHKLQVMPQEGTNWQEARDECVKMGADLATFDTQEEFEELRSMLGEVSQTDVYWVILIVN